MLGSPWVERRLQGYTGPNDVVAWSLEILGTPDWWTSPGAASPFGVTDRWSGLVCAATVLLGVFLLLPGLIARAPAGRVRWNAAIGAGTLIGTLAGLLCWLVQSAFGHNPGISSGELFVNLVPSAAAFGALLGVVTGLLLAGDSTRTTRKWQPRLLERSPAIDGLSDSNASALGQVPGDVTRYLCAAAYTDPAFARTVVEDVLADPFGAVAPSPGVDLLPVARHCLAARELRYLRDRRLCALYLVIFLIGPAWLLLGSLALGVLGSCVSSGRPRPTERGSSGTDVRASVWSLAIVALPLLGVAVLIGVGLGSLSLPGPLQWVLGCYADGIPAILLLGIALFTAYALVVGDELATEERLRTTLRRQSFVPEQVPLPAPAAPWIEDRLEAIAEAQHGNVTVYSGWSPFIGFTAAQQTWSLAIPVLPAVHLPGADRTTVTWFDSWELLDRIKLRWSELSEQQGPAGADPERLGGLVVEDRIFVHGATIADDARLLPSPGTPETLLEPDQVTRIALDPSSTARYWLTAHLPLWGGDLVPAMLLDLSVTEQTVHVHCSLHTLGPVRGRYHTVDALPASLTSDRRSALLISALRQTRSLLFNSPFSTLDHLRFESRRAKRLLRQWRAIELDPGFDYGARVSIREAALNPTYPNYYQPRDSERVLNSLTRHTLATIRDFLEEHGVDTADFRQQQQTILNHGIIQQGGTNTVENLAVGQGASAGSPGPAASEPASSR